MEINKRIVELIALLKITPSEFADEIGIQRSSVSHIISKRNKPSLDFIQKIVQRYPDIEFQWLINGKGIPFQRAEILMPSSTTVIEDDKINQDQDKIIEKPIVDQKPIQTHIKSTEAIKKIIIIYEDDRFEIILPK